MARDIDCFPPHADTEFQVHEIDVKARPLIEVIEERSVNLKPSDPIYNLDHLKNKAIRALAQNPTTQTFLVGWEGPRHDNPYADGLEIDRVEMKFGSHGEVFGSCKDVAKGFLGMYQWVKKEANSRIALIYLQNSAPATPTR